VSKAELVATYFHRGLFAVVIVVGLLGVVLQVRAIQPDTTLSAQLNAHLRHSVLRKLQVFEREITQLEDDQTRNGVMVVSSQVIQHQLAAIYYNVEDGDPVVAQRALVHLQKDISVWQRDLRVKLASTPPGSAATKTLHVPILVYHKTPDNFAAQLEYLQAQGYSTIVPQQLVASLHGAGALPPKPLIITFDDGFANQMTAFTVLRAHKMTATFYLITGGPESNWCIGANRSNPSCGDQYLSWDQIRELDQSGIITIGGHTINHRNLAELAPDQQRYEIADGKRQLEQHLGHPIYDFAYPYGSYNASAVQIARDAGYETAVSTTPGTEQSLGNLYTLYRVRDALKLP
jgi:peptidoglycan/xylan/chitin deacetylase (PgdA/CDA1 family)